MCVCVCVPKVLLRNHVKRINVVLHFDHKATVVFVCVRLMRILIGEVSPIIVDKAFSLQLVAAMFFSIRQELKDISVCLISK